MKKTVLLLFVLLLLSSLTACDFTTAGGIKTVDGHILPPQMQENAGRILDHGYPIPFEEVEIIALVRIGDWLGEKESCSYFDATVLKQYRGKVSDEIVVRQRGSSKLTYTNPDFRFTYGDEVLLLLEKSSDSRFKNEYSADDVVCDVITDEDDVQYAVNRLYMAVYYDHTIPVENISYTDPTKAEALKKALEQRNPALKSDYSGKRGVFRLSDLEPHLTGTAEENLYTFTSYSNGDLPHFSAAAHGTPYEIAVTDLYNVTPEALTGTWMQIFKDGKTSDSYLLYNGEVFPLCLSGYPGLLSALPWDYDGNGTEDLLYTASYGVTVRDPDNANSWMKQRQCYIALFDVTKKEKINLFCTNETDTPQIDLILTETEEENVFEAQIAHVIAQDHQAHTGYCPLRQYGIVSLVDGTPQISVTN